MSSASTASQSKQNLFKQLGFGLGLRPEHYDEVINGRPSVSWFEVIAENFMVDGGRPLYFLERVRERFPIAFHSVSLSIGSVDPLDARYLKLWKRLIDRFEPEIVSDHLCWTGVNGQNLQDLLPLPYTQETMDHVVERTLRVQDFLGRRILIENLSSYLSYSVSEMPEWEFLAELARRADCGLLLDVNNIYVSSVNHGFDPLEYLKAIPVERVGQIHLAGHSTETTPDGRRFLIDTHDHDVCPEVWELYGHALRRFGQVSTMIERDEDIPEYSALEAELQNARKIAIEIASEATNYAVAEPSSLKGGVHASRNSGEASVSHHAF